MSKDVVVDPKQATKSLFELAGFQVTHVWELMNQYWPRVEHYWTDIMNYPWFLVQTDRGLIEFGPRKRVYQIDWSHTDIRGIVTADDVTKTESMVHAYTMAKALEYLTALKGMSDHG